MLDSCVQSEESSLHQGKRCLIYARVSTKQQENCGALITQLGQCQEYAKKEKLDITRIAIETASGKKTTNRHELLSILEAIKPKDQLIITRLDRLSRSKKDLLRLVNFCNDRGVTIHVIDECGVLDTSDPNKQEWLKNKIEMIDYETRQISARTKSALEHKKSMGKRISGVAPYGFKFDGKMVVECPGEQAILRSAYNLRQSGLPFRKITAQLASEGLLNRKGNRFHYADIHRMLKKYGATP